MMWEIEICCLRFLHLLHAACPIKNWKSFETHPPSILHDIVKDASPSDMSKYSLIGPSVEIYNLHYHLWAVLQILLLNFYKHR